MTLRRIAMGCGIVGLILVLLAGCGVVAAIDELPSGDHPAVDFRSPQISSAREAVVPELAAQLDGVEDRYGEGRIGDRIRIDRCERGFDDFTRTDQYAYACRMSLVEVVAVGHPFRREASRLGEALLEGKCPNGTDTDRALAEPFDHPRELDWSRGDCTPGTRVPGPEIRDWLSVPPEIGETDVAERSMRPSCLREFCEVGELDLEAAADAAPPGTAALAVVHADATYYLVAWECPWPASWIRSVCNNESHSPIR